MICGYFIAVGLVTFNKHFKWVALLVYRWTHAQEQRKKAVKSDLIEALIKFLERKVVDRGRYMHDLSNVGSCYTTATL